MEKQNIALIGMMGTFKTSAGIILAKKLNFEFVDTDEALAQKYSKSVFDLLPASEAQFRQYEHLVVKTVASRTHCVISCGGGVAQQANNVEELKKTCRVVLLVASPEAILQRVSGSNDRPLLRGSDKLQKIIELLNARQPKYLAAADIIVDNTFLTSQQTAQEIFEQLALKS